MEATAHGMAIGITEFSSIAAGLSGLDHIVKNNNVAILKAEMICPGRYLVICGGTHAAVEESMAQVRSGFADTLINDRVIGNLSEGIICGLDNKGDVTGAGAVGIVETTDVVTAIYAADEAIKTASVILVGLRMANGIGGKGLVAIAGGVADVSVALDRAARFCEWRQTLIGRSFITNPDRVLIERLTGCIQN